jgi:NADPH-dependent ferric siderophore reductase
VTMALRREPPPFRRAEVARIERRNPFLVHVTFAGTELVGLDPGLPAASVRVLLPDAGADDIVLPRWNGNEFLAADGSRPPLRTLTPLRVDAASDQLDVDVVLHGEGALSDWAETATPGRRVAVSGTGRGYDIDATATRFVLAGDESALPAIGTLLPALPAAATVVVLAAVHHPDARVDLPPHPAATVEWLVGPEPGPALLAAVTDAEIDHDTRLWVAAEAEDVQRIRRHLFEARRVPRGHGTVRGYWKRGRVSS